MLMIGLFMVALGYLLRACAPQFEGALAAEDERERKFRSMAASWAHHLAQLFIATGAVVSVAGLFFMLFGMTMF